MLENNEMEYEEQKKFIEARDRFNKILSSVKREGIENLLTWLTKTDFYTAPSSSKYHGAFEHGLLYHSLNVYDCLCKLIKEFDSDNTIPEDTIIISSLLHDICKVDFYSIEYRNKKINGKWEEVPVYTIKDNFPLGHGEKSIIIIQRFINITPKEAVAITWHMGGFDSRCDSYQGKNTCSDAMQLYKLTTLLQCADVTATYLLEGNCK